MKRHGIRIAEVNEQEQLLVLETRRELERLIATRAARRASAEDKKTLAAMAQALLAAGKAGDVVEMLRQYFVAKTFIARCAGNRFSAQAIAPLYTLVAALLLHAPQGAERPVGGGAPARRAAARDRHRRRAGGGRRLRRGRSTTPRASPSASSPAASERRGRRLGAVRRVILTTADISSDIVDAPCT